MPRTPPVMNSPKDPTGPSETPDTTTAPGNGSQDIESEFKPWLSAPRDEQGRKMSCKAIFHPDTTWPITGLGS